MSLARQEHDVTGTRLVERDFNGALAVRLHQKLCLGALQADNRVVDNEQWVLAARVVGGQHNEVAQTPRRFSHQGTFRSIPVSAATEQSDNAPVRVDLLCRSQQVTQ